MALKTFLLVALASTMLALPSPEPEVGDVKFAAAEGIKERDFNDNDVSPRDEPSSLVARACSYTTGCTSLSGASSGKYCGFCTQVRGTYSATSIYQVNGGSGSSSCCSYGYSSTCASHWPAVSPNVLVNCANNGRGY